MANTVGFLKRSKELARYGIPRKRGLILAGKPGTARYSFMVLRDRPDKRDSGRMPLPVCHSLIISVISTRENSLYAIAIPF